MRQLDLPPVSDLANYAIAGFPPVPGQRSIDTLPYRFTMQRALRSQARLMRPMRWFAIAAMALYVALTFTRELNLISYDTYDQLRWTVALPVAGLVVIAVVGVTPNRRRQRAREMYVLAAATPPQFNVPGARTQAGTFCSLAVVPLMLVGLDIAGNPPRASLGELVLSLVCVSLGVTVLIGLDRKAQRARNHQVTLTPHGISIPAGLGSLSTGWSGVATAYGNRFGTELAITLQPGARVRKRGAVIGEPVFIRVTFWLVDAGWLAGVIQHYVDHPEERSMIGSAADHERWTGVTEPTATAP